MQIPSPSGRLRATAPQSPLRLQGSPHAVIVWGLAALMICTRQCDFAGVADASWAVFFLGGLYLGSGAAFALFMLAAVLVDYVVTQHLGVSSYCLSPAYVFLLPAYAALWWAGRWMAQQWNAARPLRTLSLLAASLAAAVSACFLISNTSFYWLAVRAAPPTLAGWRENFVDWYGYFLAVPFAYVGVILAVAAAVVAIRTRLTTVRL